jgi:lipid A 4'-phosphatase
VLALVVFSLWPELDRWVTALFYRPDLPMPFPAHEWPLVQFFYQGVPWLGRSLLIGTLLCLLPVLARRLSVRWRHRAWALLLVLVLGLWLAINAGLKEHWGRPRPSDTTLFGGTQIYQPVWQPSSLCDRNCSFVSGHAGTGFVLMAVGLAGAPATRRRWLRIGLLTGGLFGLGRVSQGAHFTSDIVFGALVLWAITQLVRSLWLRQRLRRRRRALG